ncbi:hypothetical protein [Muricoccus radiodurans]|uniref:hypothetical protein n=1 Tax=Muricoccus radiodurans TaxID=2231721 RepID=UPI003CF60FDE
MNITFQPVLVATSTPDKEGQLVFIEGELAAVLVRLSEQHEAAGQWFLEHGFGQLDSPTHPTFHDLQAAERWIASATSYNWVS